MTAGLLFSQMTPPPDAESRFEQWYDDDHIAHWLRLDGFVAASRCWQVPDPGSADRHHLATYERDSLAALSTPEYNAAQGRPGTETEDFLQMSPDSRDSPQNESPTWEPAMPTETSSSWSHSHVPAAVMDQFDDWYDTEHAPLLLRAAEWLRVHRYRVVSGDGGPWTHLALHELSSLDVIRSPERERARHGSKRDALVGQPWFEASGRWVYKRVVRQPD